MARREYSKLYGYKWQKYRETFLAANPLCVACQREDRITGSSVVDHIKPHKGDLALFWDTTNHQALCKQCHDRFKQSAEKGGQGFNRGCDTSGWPRDPRHDWNE